MRIFSVAVLAASLFVTGASAQPLSPGHPAGVRAARSDSSNTALMIGAGVVVMVAVGILISGNSSVVDTLQIPSQPVTVAPPNVTSSTTGTP
jgi:hypothetical protein